jgi:hypothetical protein
MSRRPANRPYLHYEIAQPGCGDRKYQGPVQDWFQHDARGGTDQKRGRGNIAKAPSGPTVFMQPGFKTAITYNAVFSTLIWFAPGVSIIRQNGIIATDEKGVATGELNSVKIHVEPGH